MLMVDENEPRCHWAIGRIEEVYRGKDGLVRSVSLKAKGKSYKRPITKLIMILESEDLP